MNVRFMRIIIVVMTVFFIIGGYVVIFHLLGIANAKLLFVIFFLLTLIIFKGANKGNYDS